MKGVPTLPIVSIVNFPGTGSVWRELGQQAQCDPHFGAAYNWVDKNWKLQQN